MVGCKRNTSWASIAVLAILAADYGATAFSNPSLARMPSVSVRATSSPATINAFDTNKVHASVSNSGRIHEHQSTTTTSLQALPNPSALLAKGGASVAQSITALSALTATITGGVFAGSLHAIAGPDHLAALIPRCCGLPWYRAVRVGAVWGLGHGVSATILGMAGFLFKKGVVVFGMGGTNGANFDVLHHAGSFMELAIGVSLIVIGLLGIKEAREWDSSDVDAIACEVNEGEGSNSTAAAPYSSAAMAVNPNPAKRAVLFNGILHGFSWDGAPSLAPAVAISTWRGSLTFLLSYALGTMGAMALATTVIGEGTRRAAGKLDRPDLPRDLSLFSSFLALVVGVVWCGLALR